MSLPPQILRIKRKRLDEPVDALFIETQANSKRQHTQHDFVFRRLLDQPTVPQRLSNALPQILATQPGDENRYERADHTDVAQSLAASKQGIAIRKDVATPRRFHLSRTTVSGPSTPATAKKRRKSKDEPHIAVFVEASEDIDMDGIDVPPTTKMRKTDNANQKSANQSAPSPSRKRPGATSRIAKDSALAKRTTTTTTTADDTAMHEAMQNYARELDIAQASELRGRLPESVYIDDVMDTSDDYVYDTYERHHNDRPPDSGTEKPLIKNVGKVDVSSGLIGYLVITEEDQPLWETYYDSDANSSDERDWDSEQDDENAENFYGADYPEDEVDSADEFDRDAYTKYRKGSDDEQFGSDDNESSDEEGKPWKKTLRGNPFASPYTADSDGEGE